MMRAKPVLWGAAVAIALGSTAALANVVVVKSLGRRPSPIRRARPFREREDHAAGRRRRHLLGPSTAQTLRGPGNFAAGQMASPRPPASAAASVRCAPPRSRTNPSIWDIDVTQSGKVCVTNASKLQLWRPDSDGASEGQIRSADGKARS